jgi:hypothetical protein
MSQQSTQGRPPEIICVERIRRQDVDPTTGSSVETRSSSLRIHPPIFFAVLTAAGLIFWLRPEALEAASSSAMKAIKQATVLFAL